MKTDLEIRKHVMRRVYAIYLLRQLSRPFIRVSALAIGALALMASVSVPDVLVNVSGVSDTVGFAKFILAAFAGTEMLVQSAVLLVSVVGLWSFADLVRNFTHTPQRV